MKIKIKRFDKDLPLPSYKSKGAAGMDMYARVETTIAPKSIGYIPLNVAIEIPEGYWVALTARSSTHKSGLMPANGIGIIDSDFCGDNDEYTFIAYNFKENPVVVERGQRIAQIVIMTQTAVDVEEVVQLGNADRGGIGSTGHK